MDILAVVFRLRFGVVLCFIFQATMYARAGYIPESNGLEENLRKAEVIGICKITAVTPDPPHMEHVSPSSMPDTNPLGLITDAQGLLEATSLQPPSVYDFAVVQRIRGSLKDTLRIHLPLISSFYYNHATFDVKPGMYCLLLLSHSISGELGSVDNTLPLIPLGYTVDLKAVDNHTASQTAIDYILSSLKNPNLRRANVFLLQKVADPEVLGIVKQFAHDPDNLVEISALRCMAFNQDISAIPLIVSLEKQTGQPWCTDAIDDYRTPRAVPMLNTVLDTGAPYSRLNASLALMRLADKSSIPYLVRAMSRDDPQQVVSFESYRTLVRIIGSSLGSDDDRNEFFLHRDTEIQRVKDWLAAHAAATQP